MAERDIRAAKRYATALFQAASKDSSLAAVETDIKALLALMEQIPSLKQVWYSPLIPTGRKRTLISTTVGGGLNPLTLSFLRLLIDKRRESILEAVAYEMGNLADASRHLVRAEAIFAIAPTPDEKVALQKSLEQRTGEHVELSVKVDPAILGGVVVRMQDTLIDGSVRGTLDRLREQLLQEA